MNLLKEIKSCIKINVKETSSPTWTFGKYSVDVSASILPESISFVDDCNNDIQEAFI